MAKQLRNFYWESELDKYLEKEKIEKNLESKSKLLRKILKERYRLCQIENCFTISLPNGMCQYHNNINLKRKVGNDN